MKYSALFVLAPLVLWADWPYSRDWREWQHQDRETIQKSFAVSGGDRLVVDNVNGFVHVTGYDGNRIEVNVQKDARAESQSALDRSKREVKLDIDQSGGLVRLFVDGPWRSRNGMNYRGDRDYGYHVNYDFEIRVPRATAVDLKTINDGDIEVKGTSGDYAVHGLNGGIDMEGISGSGVVHTLNGKVKVAFARNPRHDCEFHSLNGAIDVYFQPPLNADLTFHTLNGGVYADFDVAPAGMQVRADGSYAGYLSRRSNRNHSGRAGSGGPSLSFHALNGAIRLHTTSL